MKKFFLSSILIIGLISVYSQGIDKLQDNNGFKSYKLGTIYNHSYGEKTKFLDEIYRVIVQSKNEYIDDIPVQKVELFYIKDTLCRIILRFNRFDGYKLKNACETAFGTPTKDKSNTEATRMFNKKQEKDLLNGDYYSLLWLTKTFEFSYYYGLPQGWLDNSDNCRLVYNLNDFDKRAQRAKKKYNSADF